MNIKEITQTLAQTKTKSLKLFIGFDGFVDNIMHVVDKRISLTEFKRLEYIKDYAERIGKAAGLSTNIEWVVDQQKIGGNGPIMTNALLSHHVDVTYVGALGFPTLNPVFQPIADKATVISIENPGISDAVEFFDGKIIMGRMNFDHMTYDRLIDTYGEEKLFNQLETCDLFASVNWSMLPTMTSLWEDLLEKALPKLQSRTRKPIFFVDIADPEKRESTDIIRALHLLKLFKSYFKVILGFNKKEAFDVSVTLGLFHKDVIHETSLELVTKALYEVLEVDQLVVHPVDRAVVMTQNGYFEVKGPYVEKPKLTTGAGDNFNAGYVFGQLAGLSPQDSLLSGVCTSGFYVVNAKSPTTDELISFIETFTK
jgi:sugar/nucleoside kinase (ribokinase family)